MTSRTPRVAIIGGGIGGCTLALALRSRGVHAEIYEQAPEFREVGAAVALSANGNRVLRQLGLGRLGPSRLELGDEIAACSAVPTELIYRHWRDGHRIAAHDMGESYAERFGAPYFGIHRADLQRILVAACGHERVHLDSRLTGISSSDDGVRLEFSSGRVADADVVVGADGVHSTVRRWVTAEDPTVYSGTSGFRGLIPVEQLTRLPDPGAIQFWTGPGAHVLHYPIGDADVVNFLAVVDGPRSWPSESWVASATPEEISGAFAGWHPAVVEMVSATSLHQRWALFGQQPLNRWSRDRVALLGDAAHAMLPHHGQGANQTIEDAASLANCLAASGADEYAGALRRYELLRRTRTRQIARSSWAASDLLHLPEGPEAQRRDESLAKIPETIRWIHGHDAGAVPASGE